MQHEVKYLDLQVGRWSLRAAIAGADDDALVAVKPLAEALGLNWSGQQTKLRKNPQFSCMDIYMTAADGKEYEMLCIPVRQVGMWLCTTNARKVKPEVRDQLIAFQQNLQVVIHDALTGRVSRQEFNELKQQLAMALETIHTLMHRLQMVEFGSYRVEEATKKAAASRLAHQRYIKRNRETLQ